MQDMNDMREILSITTDVGEYNYYVVCRLTVGARDYIALTPQFGNDKGIHMFRRSEFGDGIQVSNIESSMELDEVRQEYEKVMMSERTELFKKDNVDTVVTISLDDGSETVCDILGLFDYEGTDYIAVMPIDRHVDLPIQIGLYEYAAINDDKGEVGITLSPIPSYLYPSIQEYFMNMANLDDVSVDY